MKNELATIALIVLCVIGVNAQKGKFGIITGYTSATLKISNSGDSTSESVSGFYLGLTSDFQFADRIVISPELNFVRVSENGGHSNSLFLPIMIKYYSSKAFFIQAGPALDYLLEEDPGIKKLGFGFGFGLGFDLSDKLFISSKYTLGLSDRLQTIRYGYPDVDVKFNFLHIGLGYRF